METETNIESTVKGSKYLIPEDKYDHGHPDVVYWTEYFSEQAKEYNVFVNVENISKRMSKDSAHCMANIWSDFTKMVPGFISQAVCQTTDPERQHHLIQIAYDELGGQDKGIIHSKLFSNALSSIGINEEELSSSSGIEPILKKLMHTLKGLDSQYGIVGLLLSFEIIAEENIEMLFTSLCYDKQCRSTLDKDMFFKIHRADESEHIRHSVANFLRFCPEEWHKDEFNAAFHSGIDFWQSFWDQSSRLMSIDIKSAA